MEHDDSSSVTAIVVTASTEAQCRAVTRELEARKAAGVFGASDVLVLAVPDPSNARVGSGGATFNALIVVEELLSAHAGRSLANTRVFLIHSGGDSQRLPCQSVCGKAWCALPTFGAGGELCAPVDLLVDALFRLFRGVRAGVVVASSDVLLLVPPGFPAHWPQSGATGLAIPTDAAIGPNHGVYQTTGFSARPGDPDAVHCSKVTHFWQKASVAQLSAAGAVRGDGTVLIDSGVVYFAPTAVTRLLEVARAPPLDSCSYLGLDAGAVGGAAPPALRIELYTELMMAMGGGLGATREEYGAVPTADTGSPARMAAARDMLWERLHQLPFHALVVEGGGFAHVGTTTEYLELLTQRSALASRYRLVRTAALCAPGAPGGIASVERGTAIGGADADTAPLGAAALNVLLHPPAALRGLGSVVEHSELPGGARVGSGALVSGARTLGGIGRAAAATSSATPSESRIPLIVRAGVAVQELELDGGGARVVTVLGVRDGIKDAHSKRGATLCGAPWEAVFAAAGVRAEDVWPDSGAGGAGTLWTAKLWPVQRRGASGQPLSHDDDLAALWLQWIPALSATELGEEGVELAAVRGAHLAPSVAAAWRASTRISLRDILASVDASAEFDWRRRLRGRIDVSLLAEAVATEGCEAPLAGLVARLGAHGASAAHADAALAALDAVAGSPRHGAHIASRALAIISSLLWAHAGWGGRGSNFFTGPAHNPEWAAAMSLLEAREGDDVAAAARRRVDGIAALAARRGAWSSRPHLLGRAARHYERAAALLTAQCVQGAPVAPPTVGLELPPIGAWVTATAPARVDLAGGWSDTPPITYEAAGGGFVVNVAVRVDGLQPMGCRVRRCGAPSEPVIKVYTRGPDNQGGADGNIPSVERTRLVSTLTLGRRADLRDYDQPTAPGALVKCALRILGIVDAGDSSDDGESLGSSLAAVGAPHGLEIETWSLLPHGSGLGTSSILAGTVLAALARATGRAYDPLSLVALVSKVEQMMSTGGGWQDQVRSLRGLTASR